MRNGGKTETHRLLKRAMLEDPPNLSIHPQKLPQVKKRTDRLPPRLQRPSHITPHAPLLVVVRLHQHHAVPEITPQEQTLPREPGAAGHQARGGRVICVGEVRREGGVQHAEGVDERGLAMRGVNKRFGEGAGRADGALDQDSQLPHAADVRDVGGRGVGRG